MAAASEASLHRVEIHGSSLSLATLRPRHTHITSNVLDSILIRTKWLLLGSRKPRHTDQRLIMGKTMGMISEFKEFAMRGNVVDLAVGVVIGAAFGKIVSSFVSGVVMPLIGLLVGGIDFSQQVIVLKVAELAADGTEAAPAVLLKYGLFAQSLLDFVIVAFVIFMVIRGINKMKRKEEEAPAAPPEPSDEVKLLTEIRDSLSKS